MIPGGNLEFRNEGEAIDRVNIQVKNKNKKLLFFENSNDTVLFPTAAVTKY